MVILDVQRADENLFIYETKATVAAGSVIRDINTLYNGRQKVDHICNEVEYLKEHGIFFPLTERHLNREEIEKLRMHGVKTQKCVNRRGQIFDQEVMRAGLRRILKKAIRDAKARINKKMPKHSKAVNFCQVEYALCRLQSAVAIVYPMYFSLPVSMRTDFKHIEELIGTQEVKDLMGTEDQLWLAGHPLQPEKALSDYVGSNDKAVVVVKLGQHGEAITYGNLRFLIIIIMMFQVLSFMLLELLYKCERIQE